MHGAPVVGLERTDAEAHGFEKHDGSLGEGFQPGNSGQVSRMGENFPEGTSQSDPSAVPPLDPDSLEEESPRAADEDEAIDSSQETVSEDGPSTEDETENQQAG